MSVGKKRKEIRLRTEWVYEYNAADECDCYKERNYKNLKRSIVMWQRNLGIKEPISRKFVCHIFKEPKKDGKYLRKNTIISSTNLDN